MDNSEILMDFFDNWRAVNLSRFCIECETTPQWMNSLRRGDNQPNKELVIRINKNLKKYGYGKRIK